MFTIVVMLTVADGVHDTYSSGLELL